MWHFRRKRKGEKIRDPIQGEFFATDAISNPAQALVRESIQNSLDAATGEVVTVRIYLSTSHGAAPWQNVGHWLAGAWQHFEAPRNGLIDAPKFGDDCDFLVVEDFGTSGLTGDPVQSDHVGPKNPFFLFFRAEGRSDKEQLERGRWGVGKFVFPRSSRISSHFGLTVRSDDLRVMLLGAATLKSHFIGDDSYSPDGLFGLLHDDDFVLPIEDPYSIARFRSTFKIARTNEPGLSVVVPYVDPDITLERLIDASATDYFLPILQGQLVIRIESPTGQLVLNSETLEAALKQIGNDAGSETARYVELARWGATLKDADRYVLSEAGADGGVPRWHPDLLPKRQLDRMRAELRNHGRIAVRVPMFVRSKTSNAERTYFDILLVPDRSANGRPMFAREGIVVSDIKAPRAREIRSLVQIEDRPLATFLGDSENPAHTQWQKDGSNFKGRYKYGPGTLDFVIVSVSALMKIVNSAEKEQDPSLTVDFFSLATDDVDETEKGIEKKRKDTDETKPPVVDVVPKPAELQIRRHAGGFSVSGGPAAPEKPFVVCIEVAYDCRTGNPLKRYHVADFDLESSQYKVEAEGADVDVRKRNTLLARASQRTFSIEASGFDEARDLYVKARVVPSKEDQGDASSQG